jgi:hypothetical protein
MNTNTKVNKVRPIQRHTRLIAESNERNKRAYAGIAYTITVCINTKPVDAVTRNTSDSIPLDVGNQTNSIICITYEDYVQ